MENMTVKLLKKIGQFEKIEALKGKNLPCPLDTYLTDSAYSDIYKTTITSDYGTDDGFHMNDDVQIVDDDDDDIVDVSTSERIEVIKEENSTLTETSSRPLTKPVLTICLDDSDFDSDEETCCLEEEVETSKKSLEYQSSRRQQDKESFNKRNHKPIEKVKNEEDIKVDLSLEYISGDEQVNSDASHTKSNLISNKPLVVGCGGKEDKLRSGIYKNVTEVSVVDTEIVEISDDEYEVSLESINNERDKVSNTKSETCAINSIISMDQIPTEKAQNDSFREVYKLNTSSAPNIMDEETINNERDEVNHTTSNTCVIDSISMVKIPTGKIQNDSSSEVHKINSLSLISSTSNILDVHTRKDQNVAEDDFEFNSSVVNCNKQQNLSTPMNKEMNKDLITIHESNNKSCLKEKSKGKSSLGKTSTISKELEINDSCSSVQINENMMKSMEDGIDNYDSERSKEVLSEFGSSGLTPNISEETVFEETDSRKLILEDEPGLPIPMKESVIEMMEKRENSNSDDEMSLEGSLQYKSLGPFQNISKVTLAERNCRKISDETPTSPIQENEDILEVIKEQDNDIFEKKACEKRSLEHGPVEIISTINETESERNSRKLPVVEKPCSSIQVNADVIEESNDCSQNEQSIGSPELESLEITPNISKETAFEMNSGISAYEKSSSSIQVNADVIKVMDGQSNDCSRNEQSKRSSELESSEITRNILKDTAFEMNSGISVDEKPFSSIQVNADVIEVTDEQSNGSCQNEESEEELKSSETTPSISKKTAFEMNCMKLPPADEESCSSIQVNTDVIEVPQVDKITCPSFQVNVDVIEVTDEQGDDCCQNDVTELMDAQGNICQSEQSEEELLENVSVGLTSMISKETLLETTNEFALGDKKACSSNVINENVMEVMNTDIACYQKEMFKEESSEFQSLSITENILKESLFGKSSGKMLPEDESSSTIIQIQEVEMVDSPPTQVKEGIIRMTNEVYKEISSHCESSLACNTVSKEVLVEINPRKLTNTCEKEILSEEFSELESTSRKLSTEDDKLEECSPYKISEEVSSNYSESPFDSKNLVMIENESFGSSTIAHPKDIPCILDLCYGTEKNKKENESDQKFEVNVTGTSALPEKNQDVECVEQPETEKYLENDKQTSINDPLSDYKNFETNRVTDEKCNTKEIDLADKNYFQHSEEMNHVCSEVTPSNENITQLVSDTETQSSSDFVGVQILTKDDMNGESETSYKKLVEKTNLKESFLCPEYNPGTSKSFAENYLKGLSKEHLYHNSIDHPTGESQPVIAEDQQYSVSNALEPYQDHELPNISSPIVNVSQEVIECKTETYSSESISVLHDSNAATKVLETVILSKQSDEGQSEGLKCIETSGQNPVTDIQSKENVENAHCITKNKECLVSGVYHHIKSNTNENSNQNTDQKLVDSLVYSNEVIEKQKYGNFCLENENNELSQPEKFDRATEEVEETIIDDQLVVFHEDSEIACEVEVGTDDTVEPTKKMRSSEKVEHERDNKFEKLVNLKLEESNERMFQEEGGSKFDNKQEDSTDLNDEGTSSKQLQNVKSKEVISLEHFRNDEGKGNDNIDHPKLFKLGYEVEENSHTSFYYAMEVEIRSEDNQSGQDIRGKNVIFDICHPDPISKSKESLIQNNVQKNIGCTMDNIAEKNERSDQKVKETHHPTPTDVIQIQNEPLLEFHNESEYVNEVEVGDVVSECFQEQKTEKPFSDNLELIRKNTSSKNVSTTRSSETPQLSFSQQKSGVAINIEKTDFSDNLTICSKAIDENIELTMFNKLKMNGIDVFVQNEVEQTPSKPFHSLDVLADVATNALREKVKEERKQPLRRGRSMTTENEFRKSSEKTIQNEKKPMKNYSKVSKSKDRVGHMPKAARAHLTPKKTVKTIVNENIRITRSSHLKNISEKVESGFKPHDFLSIENSIPPVKKTYADRIVDVNFTSEDSNDSESNKLLIDEGTNAKSKPLNKLSNIEEDGNFGKSSVVNKKKSNVKSESVLDKLSKCKAGEHNDNTSKTLSDTVEGDEVDTKISKGIGEKKVNIYDDDTLDEDFHFLYEPNVKVTTNENKNNFVEVETVPSIFRSFSTTLENTTKIESENNKPIRTKAERKAYHPSLNPYISIKRIDVNTSEENIPLEDQNRSNISDTGIMKNIQDEEFKTDLEIIQKMRKESEEKICENNKLSMITDVKEVNIRLNEDIVLLTKSFETPKFNNENENSAASNEHGDLDETPLADRIKKETQEASCKTNLSKENIICNEIINKKPRKTSKKRKIHKITTKPNIHDEHKDHVKQTEDESNNLMNSGIFQDRLLDKSEAEDQNSVILPPKLRRKSISRDNLNRSFNSVENSFSTSNKEVEDKTCMPPPKLRGKSSSICERFKEQDTELRWKCKNTVSQTTEKLKKKLYEGDSVDVEPQFVLGAKQKEISVSNESLDDSPLPQKIFESTFGETIYEPIATHCDKSQKSDLFNSQSFKDGMASDEGNKQISVQSSKEDNPNENIQNLSLTLQGKIEVDEIVTSIEQQNENTVDEVNADQKKDQGELVIFGDIGPEEITTETSQEISQPHDDHEKCKSNLMTTDISLGEKKVGICTDSIKSVGENSDVSTKYNIDQTDIDNSHQLSICTSENLSDISDLSDQFEKVIESESVEKISSQNKTEVSSATKETGFTTSMNDQSKIVETDIETNLRSTSILLDDRDNLASVNKISTLSSEEGRSLKKNKNRLEKQKLGEIKSNSSMQDQNQKINKPVKSDKHGTVAKHAPLKHSLDFDRVDEVTSSEQIESNCSDEVNQTTEMNSSKTNCKTKKVLLIPLESLKIKKHKIKIIECEKVQSKVTRDELNQTGMCSTSEENISLIEEVCPVVQDRPQVKTTKDSENVNKKDEISTGKQQTKSISTSPKVTRETDALNVSGNSKKIIDEGIEIESVRKKSRSRSKLQQNIDANCSKKSAQCSSNKKISISTGLNVCDQFSSETNKYRDEKQIEVCESKSPKGRLKRSNSKLYDNSFVKETETPTKKLKKSHDKILSKSYPHANVEKEISEDNLKDSKVYPNIEIRSLSSTQADISKFDNEEVTKDQKNKIHTETVCEKSEKVTESEPNSDPKGTTQLQQTISTEVTKGQLELHPKIDISNDSVILISPQKLYLDDNKDKNISCSHDEITDGLEQSEVLNVFKNIEETCSEKNETVFENDASTNNPEFCSNVVGDTTKPVDINTIELNSCLETEITTTVSDDVNKTSEESHHNSPFEAVNTCEKTQHDFDLEDKDSCSHQSFHKIVPDPHAEEIEKSAICILEQPQDITSHEIKIFSHDQGDMNFYAAVVENQSIVENESTSIDENTKTSNSIQFSLENGNEIFNVTVDKITSTPGDFEFSNANIAANEKTETTSNTHLTPANENEISIPAIENITLLTSNDFQFDNTNILVCENASSFDKLELLQSTDEKKQPVFSQKLDVITHFLNQERRAGFVVISEGDASISEGHSSRDEVCISKESGEKDSEVQKRVSQSIEVTDGKSEITSFTNSSISEVQKTVKIVEPEETLRNSHLTKSRKRKLQDLPIPDKTTHEISSRKTTMRELSILIDNSIAITKSSPLSGSPRKRERKSIESVVSHLKEKEISSVALMEPTQSADNSCVPKKEDNDNNIHFNASLLLKSDEIPEIDSEVVVSSDQSALISFSTTNVSGSNELLSSSSTGSYENKYSGQDEPLEQSSSIEKVLDCTQEVNQYQLLPSEEILGIMDSRQSPKVEETSEPSSLAINNCSNLTIKTQNSNSIEVSSTSPANDEDVAEIFKNLKNLKHFGKATCSRLENSASSFIRTSIMSSHANIIDDKTDFTQMAAEEPSAERNSAFGMEQQVTVPRDSCSKNDSLSKLEHYMESHRVSPTISSSTINNSNKQIASTSDVSLNYHDISPTKITIGSSQTLDLITTQNYQLNQNSLGQISRSNSFITGVYGSSSEITDMIPVSKQSEFTQTFTPITKITEIKVSYEENNSDHSYYNTADPVMSVAGEDIFPKVINDASSEFSTNDNPMSDFELPYDFSELLNTKQDSEEKDCEGKDSESNQNDDYKLRMENDTITQNLVEIAMQPKEINKLIDLIDCDISTENSDRIESDYTPEPTRGSRSWDHIGETDQSTQKVIVLPNNHCLTETYDMPHSDLLENDQSTQKVIVLPNNHCLTPTFNMSDNDTFNSFQGMTSETQFPSSSSFKFDGINSASKQISCAPMTKKVCSATTSNMKDSKKSSIVDSEKLKKVKTTTPMNTEKVRKVVQTDMLPTRSYSRTRPAKWIKSSNQPSSNNSKVIQSTSLDKHESKTKSLNNNSQEVVSTDNLLELSFSKSARILPEKPIVIKGISANEDVGMSKNVNAQSNYLCRLENIKEQNSRTVPKPDILQVKTTIGKAEILLKTVNNLEQEKKSSISQSSVVDKHRKSSVPLKYCSVNTSNQAIASKIPSSTPNTALISKSPVSSSIMKYEQNKVKPKDDAISNTNHSNANRNSHPTGPKDFLEQDAVLPNIADIVKSRKRVQTNLYSSRVPSEEFSRSLSHSRPKRRKIAMEPSLNEKATTNTKAKSSAVESPRSVLEDFEEDTDKRINSRNSSRKSLDINTEIDDPLRNRLKADGATHNPHFFGIASKYSMNYSIERILSKDNDSKQKHHNESTVKDSRQREGREFRRGSSSVPDRSEPEVCKSDDQVPEDPFDRLLKQKSINPHFSNKASTREKERNYESDLVYKIKEKSFINEKSHRDRPIREEAKRVSGISHDRRSQERDIRESYKRYPNYQTHGSRDSYMSEHRRSSGSHYQSTGSSKHNSSRQPSRYLGSSSSRPTVYHQYSRTPQQQKPENSRSSLFSPRHITEEEQPDWAERLINKGFFDPPSEGTPQFFPRKIHRVAQKASDETHWKLGNYSYKY
nr:titin homolog isoform X1 [Leptinotarsa decemlineata]